MVSQPVSESVKAAERALEYYDAELSIVGLFRQNWIVQVGGLTMTVDESRKSKLIYTFYPTLFEKEVADRLAQGSFRDGEGNRVIGEVILAKDWYARERANILAVLPQLRELALITA